MTSPLSKAKRQTLPLLSLGKLFGGCLFLCNPNISLFDLLPDAIGFALFLSAIKECVFVFPHFAEAYTGLRRMLWLSLAKIPAFFFMLRIAAGNLDERAIIPVFSLAFTVLELLFILPAFRALWEGFVYIGEKEGVYSPLTDGKGGSVDSVALFTIVFLLFKHVMSTLPEFTLLSLFEKMGSLEPGAFNIATLYPFFAFVGAVIVLVIGIVWLWKMHTYLASLGKDTAFHEVLTEKANEQAESIARRSDRRRSLILLCLIGAACVFTVDPLFDDRDVLPNVFAALLFLLAFFYVKAPRGILIAGKTVSGVYAALSLATFVARERFFMDFTHIDVAFRDVALTRYLAVEIFTVAESLCFAAVILLLCAAMKGFITEKTGQNLREADLVLRNEIHTSLFKKLKGFGVAGVLFAILRTVDVFVLTLVDRHIITEAEANQHYSVGTVVYSSRYGGSWFVILAVGIAFAAYAIYLLRAIKEEMAEEPN